MGLNPFWLSWCYSLQIYKWKKRGWVVLGWGGRWESVCGWKRVASYGGEEVHTKINSETSHHSSVAQSSQ